MASKGRKKRFSQIDQQAKEKEKHEDGNHKTSKFDYSKKDNLERDNEYRGQY